MVLNQNENSMDYCVSSYKLLEVL